MSHKSAVHGPSETRSGEHPCRFPTRSWKHYPKHQESYSQHVSAVLIIKMGRAEHKIRAEIANEQIYHWSPEQIKARFG